jgi:hypothetical protein
MRSIGNNWPIWTGLLLVAACGNKPLDETSQGSVLYSVTGKLTAGAQIDQIDHPVKVAVVWATHAATDGRGDLLFGSSFVTQSVDVVGTSLPASFSLSFREVPPLSVMVSWPNENGEFQSATGEERSRYATGYFVAYEDRNDDGELTLPDNETTELADRILNLSVEETFVLYVEGEPPNSTFSLGTVVVDLPPAIAEQLSDDQQRAAMLEPPPEELEESSAPFNLMGLGLDAVGPGFNIIRRHERWSRYLAPAEGLQRCIYDVYQASGRGRVSQDDVDACEEIYQRDSREFAPLATLETCLEAAGADETAKDTCVGAYADALVELMNTPFFSKQIGDTIVELPMREDSKAGRAFCPEPADTPLAFDLKRAACSDDGLTLEHPAPPPPSEWPTYCYGSHGFAGPGGEQILSAADAPPWWPCDL